MADPWHVSRAYAKARCRAQAGMLVALLALQAGIARAEPAPYRSPVDVAFSPDGSLLAIADRTAGVVALARVADGIVQSDIHVGGQPSGVVWAPDGGKVFVSQYGSASVAAIDPSTGRVVARGEAGAWPIGLALAPGRRLVLAAGFSEDCLGVMDVHTLKCTGQVPLLRQPFAVAVTPDEKYAIVTNQLPDGPASDEAQSAAVSLIDLATQKRIADIRLPAGSSCVREVVVGPQGRRAYVAHTIGRTHLPTTQLERGWVNTNGLSIIDIPGRKRIGTVLLDALLEGAADPWGVAMSPDGKRLYVTVSGTHELATIDVARLTAMLAAGAVRPEDTLGLLAREDALRRYPLPGAGPRGLDVSPDGQGVAVAMYFSGSVVLLDVGSAAPRAVIALAPQPESTSVRRGEQIFHDAAYVKQGWLTCATCHPQGRSDGMNWDLLNDGLGNPKNTLSLVVSDQTPPAMARRTRASMEVAAAAGFAHIAQLDIEPADLHDVIAYVRSLKPAQRRHVGPADPLAARVARGRAVFNRQSVGCTQCHATSLYTDRNAYDVGTRSALDRTGTFDTPTLLELWRTGPYLHDGSAKTVYDVLVTRNQEGKHGKTAHLTTEEVEDLMAFLDSL